MTSRLLRRLIVRALLSDREILRPTWWAATRRLGFGFGSVSGISAHRNIGPLSGACAGHTGILAEGKVACPIAGCDSAAIEPPRYRYQVPCGYCVAYAGDVVPGARGDRL